MAIDSEVKRKSIAAINLIPVGPMVVPSGSFSQADRQVIGYSYAGILADEPAVESSFTTILKLAIGR